jgi:hypothetical protein
MAGGVQRLTPGEWHGAEPRAHHDARDGSDPALAPRGHLCRLLSLCRQRDTQSWDTPGAWQPQKWAHVPGRGLYGGGPLCGPLSPMPQACLPTSTSANHHGRRHQGGGAHIGAGGCLHLTRPGPLCCEPGIAGRPMRRVGWDRARVHGVGSEPTDLLAPLSQPRPPSRPRRWVGGEASAVHPDGGGAASAGSHHQHLCPLAPPAGRQTPARHVDTAGSRRFAGARGGQGLAGDVPRLGPRPRP